jgi:hypothetical protein
MSDLPPKPDFAAIEAAVGKTPRRRTTVLALIGNLVHCWSNNESLFIYVMMLLMRTDLQTASIIFGTLNTTRARMDLIERLAKLNVSDPEVAKRLSDVVGQFNESTKIRNEFNHCMYGIDAEGEITHTSQMRIQESRSGKIGFGASRPMDEARIHELQAAIVQMTKLNRDIWDLLDVLRDHTRLRPSAAAE